MVCGVCTRWRHAAIGTPKLWSSIVYYSDYVQGSFEDAEDRFSAHKRADLEDRITTYLARSKHCSIDVLFHIFANIDLPEGDDLQQPVKFFKKVILPHLFRCRTLDVQSYTFAQLSYIFPLTGRLDRLKSLRCGFVDPNGFGNPSLEESSLTLLPENSGVCLVDLTVDSYAAISMSNIDGSALLKADLEGPESMWDGMLDLLLRASPVLQTLRMGIPLPPRALWSPNWTSLVLPNETSSYSDLRRHSKISLPALRHLSCDEEGVSNGFGAMLNLPNLTHAKFCSLYALVKELDNFNTLLLQGGTDESRIPARRLLGPTSHLQYLTLHDVLELRPLVTELLASTPTIIMFEMAEWGGSARVAAMELLMIADDKRNNAARVGDPKGSTGGDDRAEEQAPLLPSLRVLVVWGGLGEVLTDSLLVDPLTESRTNLRIIYNQEIVDGDDVVQEEVEAIYDGRFYSIQG